ncbi:MAG: hypothetical protein FJ143_04660 [Deltaproteobacteria bacterium]|nr:hypothetical protein [Deltaproteobacteria bacterium]
MNGQSMERLMDVVLQMKINLAHINDTLHQQSFEIRQQVGAVFEEERKSLERCLGGIDEKLKECASYVNDYQQMHTTLTGTRAKLVQLGAEPSVLPAALPGERIEDVILWRVQELKAAGKLTA